MPDAQTGMVPLSRLLEQLAHELATVDLQIHALETVWQRSLTGRPLSAQQMADLQGIDHARQTLTCLSTFLQDLSRNAESALKVDPRPAAKRLTLGDLAARLSNPDMKVGKPQPEGVHYF